MSKQLLFLDIFDTETRERVRAESLAERFEWFKHHCDWSGPAVGEYCRPRWCILSRVDISEYTSCYCAGERIKLIEEVSPNKWIGEICMGINNWWNKKPAFRWPKDGTKVYIDVTEMDAYVHGVHLYEADGITVKGAD